MAEQASLATPFSGPGGRLIASPFQFTTDDDTNLRIISANSQAGVVLALQGRRIDASGTIQIINETHAPNSDRTKRTQDYKLGKGAILNLTVFATTGTPLIGQTYVIVQIIRGFGTATLLVGTLLAGYVTAVQPLGFPGSPIVDSITGDGWVHGLAGTVPALGNEVSEVVPTGARWGMLGHNMTFHASGAAGARVLRVFYTIGGVVPAVMLCAASSGPGNIINLLASQATTDLLIDTGTVKYERTPMPENVILRAGDKFSTNTLGIDAGDQWNDNNYFVREWLEVSS